MVEDVVVRVRLAGGFSVTVGARVLGEAAWPGRQGRLVLAYLACHGDRPVPRSELVELVWLAGPPRSAAMVLMIDDVQWADGSTLRLLRHLGRGADLGLVLLVIGCRAGEVGDYDPLTAVLAEL